MTQSKDASTVLSGSRSVTFVVIVASSMCVYAIRQADPDLFGYLAYGRLFVQQGLGTSDPFAYTSTGLHWVAFEYLAQMSLWMAYDTFGPVGLIALKCLLGGLAIYFLSIAVRTTTSQPIVWVPVFLLCTSTVSRFFVFRPQLFTFMLFALYVAVLVRFLLRGSAPLWLLPIAMLLWANTHGGFLAGLAAIALVIVLCMCRNVFESSLRTDVVFSGTKPLWLTLAACTSITLINPHGIRLWQYVLTEVLHDTNRRHIAEWQPPGTDSDPWSAVALTFIAVVLLIAGSTAQMHHKRVAGVPPWLWICSCLPALALASLSVRHVPLAALWTAPVITLLAAAAWTMPRPAFKLAWMIVGGCSLVPIVLTTNYIISNPRLTVATDGAILGPTHPCTAVAFMKQNHLRGNLYTPLWWGGYVTWEMYPDIRVSMDGRNISLFSRSMVEENFQFYASDTLGRDLDAPFRYDTDMMLVPADRPVLVQAGSDQRWREVFRDSQASVFARVNTAGDAMRLPIATDSRTPSAGDCAQVLR